MLVTEATLPKIIALVDCENTKKPVSPDWPVKLAKLVSRPAGAEHGICGKGLVQYSNFREPTLLVEGKEKPKLCSVTLLADTSANRRLRLVSCREAAEFELNRISAASKTKPVRKTGLVFNLSNTAFKSITDKTDYCRYRYKSLEGAFLNFGNLS